MPPHLFIVPGIYEGSEAFEPFRNALRNKGFVNVHTTSLPSTGTETKNGHCISMEDDIAAIVSDLARYVDEAKTSTVVILMHSAGGFLGSAALEGLTVASRKKNGQAGGVSSLIFFTAAIMPEGYEHTALPFFQFNVRRWRSYQSIHMENMLTAQQESGSSQTCKDPDANLFNDTTAENARLWSTRLKCQPGKGWERTTRYCGWRELPSDYILCDEDKVISLDWQQKCADMAGSKVVRVAGAGHMAHITQPFLIATIVGDLLRRN